MPISKLRAVPPSLWLDEALIGLPLPVRWTAVGLRMHADDHGRETTTDWMLRPSIWPGNQISEDELIEHLLILDAAGYIVLYDHDGRTYYQIAEWPSVSHRARSRHPAPPDPDARRSAAGISPESRRNHSSDSLGLRGGRERGQGADRGNRGREPREGAGRGPWAEDGDEWDDWGEGGAGSQWEAAGEAPEPFCPEHMPSGSGGEPCRDCGDHRLARREWDRVHSRGRFRG